MNNKTNSITKGVAANRRTRSRYGERRSCHGPLASRNYRIVAATPWLCLAARPIPPCARSRRVRSPYGGQPTILPMHQGGSDPHGHHHGDRDPTGAETQERKDGPQDFGGRRKKGHQIGRREAEAMVCMANPIDRFPKMRKFLASRHPEDRGEIETNQQRCDRWPGCMWRQIENFSIGLLKRLKNYRGQQGAPGERS